MSQVEEEKKPVANVRVLFNEIDIPEGVEEVSKKGWVKWGKDNLYPQFLWYMVYNSPIHQGIVNTKVDYISSGGLTYVGDQTEWVDVERNGKSKYTLTEIVEAVTLDDVVSNSYYLVAELDLLTKKWFIDKIDFELIRPNEDGTLFYYSEDWSTDRQGDKTGYETIPSFFAVERQILAEDLTVTKCILQVKQASRQQRTLSKTKKITGGFFSIPSYNGGIDSILTDIEINAFRLSEVVNGYMGGALVTFTNGIPESEADRNAIVKASRLEATDRYKRGGLAVAFSDGVETAPTVQMLNGNDLDKRYESTEVGLTKKIMIAHSVTNPKLFGVMAEGVMSESNDKESFDRFQKTYASKRRKGIADSINFLLKKLNKVTGEIEINTPTLTIDSASSDNSQKVLESINSLSPLVANKVLDSMTPNQILSLVGLPPTIGGDVIQAPSATFGKQDKDPLVLFEKCGRKREGISFLTSRKHESFDTDDEEEFIRSIFKTRFASLTDIQLNILQLISKGKNYDQIVKKLEIEPVDLSKNLKSLNSRGYLEGNALTSKGQIEVVNIESVEVVYTYEERPDAPPLIGTSRDFCKTMLRLNKVYTREEINNISSAIGRNVWLYRGGWYHNPETDRNQPSCRHFWSQSIIVKR